MAIALILFCVFQVMTAVSHVTATSSLLPSLLPNSTQPVAANMPTDPEDKHDKRSLNAFPFENKYLGTETMTLEITENGSVRGVKNLTPNFGVMQFTMACMMRTIAPSLDKAENKNYGKVSLKWQKSNRFLCMNEDGDVYSSVECTDECEFKQKLEPNHVLYSLKYFGPKPGKSPFKTDNSRQRNRRRKKKWYLAIDRKTGVVLPGWRARKGKKHAHLIARPVADHGYKETRYSITTTSDPKVIQKVSMDPKGSVSVENRENEGTLFVHPTSQSSKTKQQSKESKRKCNKKDRNKCRSHRHRHEHGTKRGAKPDCDQTADPLNLFRLNKNCKQSKAARNVKNQPASQAAAGGASVPFTAFNNQNAARGATSNPTQRRTSRDNLFSFSPKR